MKALPPPPSQLELWSKGRALSRVEDSERQYVLRALAEILLVAAETARSPAHEVDDEAR